MAANVLKTKERVPNLSRGELMKQRKKGNIPAVLFGNKVESVSFYVDQVEFSHIFDDKGKIFEIEVGGKKRLVNTKNIQYDPLRKFMYHIDFYELQKGVETTVKVPVILVGEAKGQKAGGNIQLRQTTLEVTGMPMNIPEEIEVDVTNLDIGDNLHVSDLKKSDKYTIDTEGEITVATCAQPRRAEATPDTEETMPEETETTGASADTVETKEETKEE